MKVGRPYRRVAWPLVAQLLMLACGSAALAAESQPISDGVTGLLERQMRVQAVVARVAPSVVGLRIADSVGSGVIVSPEGLVVTAGHVARTPRRAATFLLADGRKAAGVTLGIDRAHDCALMQITDPGPWPAVEMGKSESLEASAWCVALGHPLGYQDDRPAVVRLGRLLERADGLLRTDCQIVAGDSGGPLFDLDARLIGVHSKIGAAETMNYHVAIDTVRAVWDAMLRGEMLAADGDGRDAPAVREAWSPALRGVAGSVVRVRSGPRDAALGTVVGAEGWILTKASELRGEITCLLPDGTLLPADWVGTDADFDLALLRVNHSGLVPAVWSAEPAAAGESVAAPDERGQAIAVGVVGAPARRIPPSRGMLGIGMKAGEAGIELIRVLPGSPAAQAGFQVGDILTEFGGQPVDAPQEVTDAIRSLRPHETVTVTLRRGDDVLSPRVQLVELNSAAAQRRTVQNRTGAGMSRRHNDFPAAFQHDAALAPGDCGGPLVNLRGQAVGINIARGGRTDVYCLPAERIPAIVASLRQQAAAE